ALAGMATGDGAAILEGLAADAHVRRCKSHGKPPWVSVRIEMIMPHGCRRLTRHPFGALSSILGATGDKYKRADFRKQALPRSGLTHFWRKVGAVRAGNDRYAVGAYQRAQESRDHGRNRTGGYLHQPGQR